MNILFHAALAAVVLAGLSSPSYSLSAETVDCGWNDAVGGRLTSELNYQVSHAKRSVEELNGVVDKIRELKPIEYNSHASELNDCIRRMNECMG